VAGVAYEVDVEVLDPGEGFPGATGPLPQRPTVAHAAPKATASAPRVTQPAPAEGGHSGVASPIAGTVLELRCRPGDPVAVGQTLLVLEAMKMKTNITASAAGRVKAVPVAVGDTVREGQILVELD
jgi:biotin carboxyl carrier protein